jgi:hypothetical protein
VTEAELQQIERRGYAERDELAALVAQVRRLIAIADALSTDMRLLTPEQEGLLMELFGEPVRGTLTSLVQGANKVELR